MRGVRDLKIVHEVASSKQEAAFVKALEEVFPQVVPSYLVPDARLAGKHLIHCDAYLPSVHCLLEFDGSYWHGKRLRADLRKVKTLVRASYRVVRVREVPLPSLGFTHPAYLELFLPQGVPMTSLLLPLEEWLRNTRASSSVIEP